MSLPTIGEAVKGLLSALGDALDAALKAESDSIRDNRPPVSPTAKAMESWPTDGHDTARQVSPAFEGHPVPLGGDS